MTREAAIKMLKAKLECMTRDVSGCDNDCNRKLCGECYLNYEQGNMGEQKEYLRMSIDVLERTRWIPVTERTPDPGDDYLVTIEHNGEVEGVDLATLKPDGMGYIDGKWDTTIDWIEGSPEQWHVTAWQELPEGYRRCKND